VGKAVVVGGIKVVEGASLVVAAGVEAAEEVTAREVTLEAIMIVIDMIDDRETEAVRTMSHMVSHDHPDKPEDALTHGGNDCKCSICLIDVEADKGSRGRCRLTF
jgi:hypothetical protein